MTKFLSSQSTSDDLRELLSEGLGDTQCAEYMDFAAQLRGVESASLVAAEQSYHQQKIDWIWDLICEGIEGADVALCLVDDHRRKAKLCLGEIERREHLGKLPPSRVLLDLSEQKRAIKERTLDVISNYMRAPLQKRGKEHYGYCIFHDDQRHPSLRVNAEKKLWYCDVCSIGGDVFDFVGRAERLTHG